MKEKISILLSDDNVEFTNTLTTYLEKQEDIEVIGVAKDGNEAYQMIINTKPDVVLLDIIMPHLDGLGVLEKVGNTKLEKTPIFIMLSAVGQDKITQRAINLGAQYYVVKPFDIELLVKRIRDVRFNQSLPSRGNFISREARPSYIEIEPSSKNDKI